MITEGVALKLLGWVDMVPSIKHGELWASFERLVDFLFQLQLGAGDSCPQAAQNLTKRDVVWEVRVLGKMRWRLWGWECV